MGHGVVADNVSGLVDGANDVGPLADEAPDHEEAGAELMLGEDFEQLVGTGIVGAIVEGERDLIGIAVGNESGTEELRPGREGGIDTGSGKGSNGGSDGGQRIERETEGGCQRGNHWLSVYRCGICELGGFGWTWYLRIFFATYGRNVAH